jgi:hypothetical protein
MSRRLSLVVLVCFSMLVFGSTLSFADPLSSDDKDGSVDGLVDGLVDDDGLLDDPFDGVFDDESDNDQFNLDDLDDFDLLDDRHPLREDDLVGNGDEYVSDDPSSVSQGASIPLGGKAAAEENPFVMAEPSKNIHSHELYKTHT